MWLFDDILKKPVAPATDPLSEATSSWQGRGQPSQDDGSTPIVMANPTPITIEKSAETTIFGQETEDLAIEKQNEGSLEPANHAEEAGSSLIISTLAMEPTSAPMSPMEDTVPQETVETTSTPLVMTENQEEVPLVIDSTATADSTNNDSISLFEHLETVDTPLAVETTLVESPLFGEKETALTSVNSPADPASFIKKSLADIDTMIATIEKRHDAKVEETQWYEKEEARFADLKKEGYNAIDAIDAEKEHALHLRSLLEAELEPKTEKVETQETSKTPDTTLSLLTQENKEREPSLAKVKEALQKEEDLVALTGL